MRDMIIDVLLSGAAVLDPREDMDPLMIGYVATPEGNVAAYSVTKVLRYFMDQGMTGEEAQEYFDYNVIRAIPYMGDRPPMMVYDTF